MLVIPTFIFYWAKDFLSPATAPKMLVGISNVTN